MLLNRPRVSIVPDGYNQLHLSRYGTTFCAVGSLKLNTDYYGLIFVTDDGGVATITNMGTTSTENKYLCSIDGGTPTVCVINTESTIEVLNDEIWRQAFTSKLKILDFVGSRRRLCISTRWGPLGKLNWQGEDSCQQRFIITADKTILAASYDWETNLTMITNQQGKRIHCAHYILDPYINLMPRDNVMVDQKGQQYAAQWTTKIHSELPDNFRARCFALLSAMCDLPAELRIAIIAAVFANEIIDYHEMLDPRWQQFADRLR